MPGHTARRAQALIETLLNEMRKGLRDPDYCTTKEWDRVFGNKQSMVVNLQKLVTAMAALHTHTQGTGKTPMAAEAAEPISDKEMDLLKAWLAEAP